MNYYGIPLDDKYLKHYGITGMKWGVRRYQNPDGSLTDAGRKRYGKYINKSAKRKNSRVHEEILEDIRDKFPTEQRNLDRERNKINAQAKNAIKSINANKAQAERLKKDIGKYIENDTAIYKFLGYSDEQARATAQDSAFSNRHLLASIPNINTKAASDISERIAARLTTGYQATDKKAEINVSNLTIQNATFDYMTNGIRNELKAWYYK